MAETITDFNANLVAASRQVLFEVVSLLADFKDDVVLVGGTAPEFLIPKAAVPYIGTSDVDLAIRPRRLGVGAFLAMQNVLESHGYRTVPLQFAFAKVVEVNGQKIEVKVDILTGGTDEDSGGPNKVWGFRAPGCELAFEAGGHATVTGRAAGEGGESTVTLHVAGIVPLLVMKASALCEREHSKCKDAWDIDYCLRFYPGGVDEIIRQFRLRLHEPAVADALAKLRAKFASVDDVGPQFVADFEEIADAEDRAIRCRRAYELARDFLDRVEPDAVDLIEASGPA